MDAGGGRQLAFDVGLDGLDGHRRAHGRSQERHAQAVCGLEQLGRDVEALGHHDARGFERHEGFDSVPCLFDRETGQVGQLGGPQDLHALGLNLAHETGQGQAGLLHAVERHAAAQPRLARQEHKPQASGFAQQGANRQFRHEPAAVTQYLSSSSTTVRYMAGPSSASSNRCRNPASRNRRDSRASALR